MPIFLLPQNREAHAVITYYLPSIRWAKSKDDGLHRPEFDAPKVRDIMRALDIESKEVFRKVCDCILSTAELLEG